jgi:hypothetical protein
MTRKDYIVIAEALRKQYQELNRPCGPLARENDGVLCAAVEIADALQRDNARFSREHFLAVVRGEKDLRSRPSRNGRAS